MFSTWNIQFRPFYKLKFQIQHGLHGDCLKCHCSLITNTTLYFMLNLFTVMVFCLVQHVDTEIWPSLSPQTIFVQAYFLYLPKDVLHIYPFTYFTKSLVFVCPGGHPCCVPWFNDVEYKMEWTSFLNMVWGKYKNEHLNINIYFLLCFNVDKEVTHKGKNWGNKVSFERWQD